MWNGITELWMIQEQENMRRREMTYARRAALRAIPLRQRALRAMRIRTDRDPS